MIDDSNSSPFRGYVRPAIVLAACVLVIALLLLPVAWNRSGSAGLSGLLIAAVVCLAAGWIAETLAFVLRRSASPLGVMMVGMAIRMLPPLGICLALAVQHVSARQHIAFIFYLLAFYLVTL